MKKLLDGVLLLLVLGVPLYLVIALPERGRDPGPRPPLEIPEPLPAEPPPTLPPVVDGTPPPAVPENGGAPPVNPPGNSGTGTEARSPILTAYSGYSYRGGRTPLPGPLPLQLLDQAAPVADGEGLFTVSLGPGPVGLGELGDSPLEVILTGGNRDGLLSVHRYPPTTTDEFALHPTDSLLLQPDGALPRLLVRGVADLPDGAEVAVRLFVAGYSLDRALLRVRDGRFGGELPLSARVYHSGVYDLQIAWGPNLATRPTLERVAGTPWADLENELRREVGVFFGTPEEASEQTREIREYYQRALNDLEGARDMLLVAGAKARRKRSLLLDDPDRASRLETHPLAPQAARLFGGRKLRLEKWRSLIDESLPEHVGPYLSFETIPFPDKHPRAAHNLVMVAQQVLKYSRLESTIIYASMGIERDSRDFVQNFDFEPETERQQTLMRLRNFADAVRTFSGL